MILPPLPEPTDVIRIGTQLLRAFTATQMQAYGELCVKTICGGKHRGPKFSAKDVAYIRDLHAQGFAYKAVRRQIEMSEATFTNITHRRGAYK